MSQLRAIFVIALCAIFLQPSTETLAAPPLASLVVQPGDLVAGYHFVQGLSAHTPAGIDHILLTQLSVSTYSVDRITGAYSVLYEYHQPDDSRDLVNWVVRASNTVSAHRFFLAERATNPGGDTRAAGSPIPPTGNEMAVFSGKVLVGPEAFVLLRQGRYVTEFWLRAHHGNPLIRLRSLVLAVDNRLRGA